MSALRRFPNLTPLILAALPSHDMPPASYRDLHAIIGIGAANSVRIALQLLERDARASSILIPVPAPRGGLARLYRRTLSP